MSVPGYFPKPRGHELIAIERQRQITDEKWTVEHDDEHHPDCELALAAMCYAAPPVTRDKLVDTPDVTFLQKFWPWTDKFWKPSRPVQYGGDHISAEVSNLTGRIRELAKAGALIAAEIDRLYRIRIGTILERTMDPGRRR